MRTTLTLDDDVAAGLQSLMADKGLTLKAAVNQALRLGLSAADAASSHPPYRIPPVHVGAPYLPDLDDIGEILLAAEGDDHR